MRRSPGRQPGRERCLDLLHRHGGRAALKELLLGAVDSRYGLEPWVARRPLAKALQVRGTPGAQAGDGGFVEVSSHGQLNFAGMVDTRAPAGKIGTLLLDPADYYIVMTLGGSPAGASMR